jgi:hypothetical protein
MLFYCEERVHATIRVYIFGTGITFYGRSDVSQTVVGPSRLQLCAVLERSRVKLSEYIYSQHDPATACLMSERRGNVIPVPKTPTLLGA